eukprot:COSAG01_NODE_4352_length_5113_cov_1.836059_4_plen_218_part_00
MASKKRNVIAEEWIADFDGTVYKLQSGAPEESADGKNKDLLCLSIQVTGFAGVASATPDFLAQTCFAPYVRETEATKDRAFNCTLQANIAELAEEDYGAQATAPPPFASCASCAPSPPSPPSPFPRRWFPEAGAANPCAGLHTRGEYVHACTVVHRPAALAPSSLPPAPRNLRRDDRGYLPTARSRGAHIALRDFASADTALLCCVGQRDSRTSGRA